MKKILCLLLGICITAALTACSRPNPSGPSTENTTQSTQQTVGESQGPTDATNATNATDATQTTEPSVQVPSLPMVSISLPLIRESSLAADGTEVFRYSFQDVSLNITDAAIAQIVTLDLLQRMDAYTQTVADLHAQAFQDYVPGESWDTYYCNVIYTPCRIDETLLSLRGLHTSYDGNVHPTTSMTSATYDLITGKFLSVLDILSEESGAAGAMCDALLKQLDKVANEHGLFAGYESTVRDQFSVDLNKHHNWYFTNGGICFYFPPFELAPNASGVIEVTVPYSELAGVLRDAYFPGEQPAVNAKLSGGWFDETDLNQFSHFSELLSTPDARRALLWTDTILYNVQLEQGHWDTAANQFVVDAVVFAASCIAQDDALVLRCEFSDTTPTLRLRYCAGGTEQSCYITKNAATGPLVLTPVN